MITKPVIAIIGVADKMGFAIARLFARAQQRILLVDGDKEKLLSLAGELKEKFPAGDIAWQTCPREGSWEADIIILASSTNDYHDIAGKIKTVATGKIVISVSNSLRGATHPACGMSAAEELQKHLPYSKVIKTFNARMVADVISTAIDGSSNDIFIAGNNAQAIGAVEALVREVGFHPVVVGDLSVSEKLERLIAQISTRHLPPESRKVNYR